VGEQEHNWRRLEHPREYRRSTRCSVANLEDYPLSVAQLDSELQYAVQIRQVGVTVAHLEIRRDLQRPQAENSEPTIQEAGHMRRPVIGADSVLQSGGACLVEAQATYRRVGRDRQSARTSLPK